MLSWSTIDSRFPPGKVPFRIIVDGISNAHQRDDLSRCKLRWKEPFSDRNSLKTIPSANTSPTAGNHPFCTSSINIHFERPSDRINARQMKIEEKGFLSNNNSILADGLVRTSASTMNGCERLGTADSGKTSQIKALPTVPYSMHTFEID